MDLRRYITPGKRSVEAGDASRGKAVSDQYRELLGNFLSPAFLAGANAEIIYKNAHSEALLSSLKEIENSKLGQAIVTALSTNTPSHYTFTYGEGDVIEVVDLTLLPILAPEKLVLVTGKSATLQRNLTSALVSSRQMFKDLVTCSAEFVWETDSAGRFQFVSPRGAIGFTVAELDGRKASNLIVQLEHEESSEPGSGVDGSEIAASSPFDTDIPVHEQIVWLQGKSGELFCMRVSSIPVFDDQGNRTGCRGAGHDITDEVRQRERLEKHAAQEKMLEAIIDAIRLEINPERLFKVAATGACEALNSTRIWLGRRNSANVLEVGFKSRIDDAIEARLFDWFDSQLEKPSGVYSLTCFSEGPWQIIVSPIFSAEQIEGVIALVRQEGVTEIDDSEQRLLRLLSDHLGVALIQVKAREKLELLSHTDELTGLWNRRAFHENVKKRLAQISRVGTENALLYIDLDNFKPVNDRFGHKKGDAVLKGISTMLNKNVRTGDFVSRLGGDEFAIWLQDVNEEKAVAKAMELQKKCCELSEQLKIGEPALGLSIGIGLVDGSRHEKLEELLARADAAMYEVKSKGKGTFSVACPTTDKAKTT
ncbi:MAG: diguanylate cyclase [Sneathiella sp.]|nr:diguanylate cyclase [Sneathiella sp.]